MTNTPMHFTKDLLFTKRSQVLSSDATTVLLYQILLGRDPENSFVIEEAKTQPISQLVHSFFASSEFTEHVVGPIRDGKRLRHELIAPSPSSEQRAWIASMLVLTSAQEKALLSASTWREFFRALLPFGTVANQPEPAQASRTIGRIEEVGQASIRGWALKLPIDEELAESEVECFIGEYRVGRASCTEFRPDLKQVLGGNGKAGFTLTVDPDVRASSFDGLDVRLVDADTGALIWGPIPFTGAGANLSALAMKVQEAVAAIEWQVSELKSMAGNLTGRVTF